MGTLYELYMMHKASQSGQDHAPVYNILSAVAILVWDCKIYLIIPGPPHFPDGQSCMGRASEGSQDVLGIKMTFPA